jgi:tetratricopeptide (TPR) repeat protein
LPTTYGGASDCQKEDIVMSWSLRIATCAIFALLPGVAVAQQVGDEAPDLMVPKGDRPGSSKDAVSLFERYPNRIIVLYYWSSQDSQSLDFFSNLNNLDEKYGPRGVTIIGITRMTKGVVEKMTKERTPTFPLLATTAVEGRAWRFPAPRTAYIIDAHRRIAYARFDATDARENLEEKIQTVLARTPTLAATDELLQKNQKKLAEFIAQKDFGRAYSLAKAFKDFFRDKEDAGQEEQIDETLRQISLGTQELLESARQDLKAENNEDAASKLASLSVRLTGLDEDKDKKGKGKRSSRPPSGGRRGRTQEQTEAGKDFRTIKEDVEREIGRMESDNYTKAIVLKALDNARGEVRNDQAVECMENQQYSEARELYRSVVDDYAGTAAAEAAQQAIDRIENDPEMRKAVAKAEATGQANRWYDLGDRFARADMFDKAREYFEKVIKEYPTSTAAQKATDRLAHLADEEKTSREVRQKREQPKQATSEKKDSKP